MKIFENGEYKIEYSERLNLSIENLLNNLNINNVLNLFNIDKFRKIKIILFYYINIFRDYINEMRGNNSLPKYARGVFDGGNIYLCISNYKNIDEIKLSKKLIHEIFHIVYKELVWNKDNKERIVWFDEGMAQFISGEYSKILLDEELFNNWFYNILQKTKEIPVLNGKTHQNNFVTDTYNGYALSLISIKYLYDTLGLEELKKLLYDNEKIIGYGKSIANDSINYYKEKLNIKNGVLR